MNVVLNRLDPNVPDPVESRRRAAGRLVRIAYATVVFGVLAFFVVYFGRPLVYLGGPGVVSSSRFVISLPHVVQVIRMNVVSGSEVKAGDEIGLVWSPQHDSIVATYMRSLTEIAARTAELRIKARVSQETLEVSRSYQTAAEEAVERVESQGVASTAFRLEVLRERALARKSVISQEAEVAEASTQLASLDAFNRQVRDHLDEVERTYGGGRVLAPIAGIISTAPARIGQSLMAGTAIAEILDPNDVFVDWYVPNERLVDPRVGNKVTILFGNRRLSGTVTQILPVSDVYAGTQAPLARERIATQIARIRFSPGAQPPLNSTVYVHMHYTDFSAAIADMLIRLFKLGQA